MLAEVARQVLHGEAELKELTNARLLQLESGIAELALQRVAGILVFPRTHQAGETGERLFVEAEHLADFACRRASTIGDNVGRHSSAELAVTFVHVLDRLLALLSARKFHID